MRQDEEAQIRIKVLREAASAVRLEDGAGSKSAAFLEERANRLDADMRILKITSQSDVIREAARIIPPLVSMESNIQLATTYRSTVIFRSS